MCSLRNSWGYVRRTRGGCKSPDEAPDPRRRRCAFMTDLPALSPEEAEHSRRLVDRIRDEIDAHQGWISFERYMEMALYEPGLGYYSAGAAKLGASGDFVTAPEI